MKEPARLVRAFCFGATPMSDQDQQDQQQQDDAAFAAGFESVRNAPDDFGQSEARHDQEPAQKEPEAKEADKAPEQKDDVPVMAGLTESQIKTLLERASRVDAIEDQLRKAHGKIGELNGRMGELASHKAQPTQTAPAAPVDDAELAAVERDYPEVAKL